MEPRLDEPALDKIIDRARKLYAKYESLMDLGNTEEAASFLAGVNKMLLKHKLEMTDLELEQEESEDALGDVRFVVQDALKTRRTSRRIPWHDILARSLAKANFCRLIYATESGYSGPPGDKNRKWTSWVGARFVGHTSDIELVKYLFTVLVREGERLAILHERQVRVAEERAAERAGRPVEPPKQPKRAFLYGYSVALADRLAKTRAEAVRGSSTALVRLNQIQARVDDYYKKIPGLRVVKRTNNDTIFEPGSFAAGKAAGDAQSLAANAVKPGDRPSTRPIGAGQKLLGGGS